ncbi:unnamed protein product [Didymodactylos carnosus]|uniref:Uncharacterized protein n=1 Tax=Didymodactylos carnosus TaxID=1234261 RepID=A0A8S2IJK9_9BILA|nr:unnamed protein product [Didymodactylos carnosus]CAF3760317.1 unnamed protein product [Didymodactylos carnosus]
MIALESRDHGTQSQNVLHGDDEAKLSEKRTNDNEFQNTIQMINLQVPPQALFKFIVKNGIQYNEGCVINTSTEHFPKSPTLDLVKYIINDGINFVFIYQKIKIIDYSVPVFIVQVTDTVEQCLFSNLVYKLSLKLVIIFNIRYVALHPYGIVYGARAYL